jgi:hypothetical protein
VIVDSQGHQVEVEDPASNVIDEEIQIETPLSQIKEQPAVEDTHEQPKESNLIKIDLGADDSSDDGIDTHDIGSPAINVISENNVVNKVVEAHQSESMPYEINTDKNQVIPQTTEHVLNPDEFGNQEQLEKYIHENDVEDQQKLNVQEAVDDPKRSTHFGDSMKFIDEPESADAIPCEEIDKVKRQGTVSEVGQQAVHNATKQISQKHISTLKQESLIENTEPEEVEYSDTPKWSLSQNHEGLNETEPRVHSIEMIEGWLTQGNAIKDEGNQYFRNKDYQNAKQKYDR